jgi:hypothetical protein
MFPKIHGALNNVVRMTTTTVTTGADSLDTYAKKLAMQRFHSFSFLPGHSQHVVVISFLLPPVNAPPCLTATRPNQSNSARPCTLLLRWPFRRQHHPVPDQDRTQVTSSFQQAIDRPELHSLQHTPIASLSAAPFAVSSSALNNQSTRPSIAPSDDSLYCYKAMDPPRVQLL